MSEKPDKSGRGWARSIAWAVALISLASVYFGAYNLATDPRGDIDPSYKRRYFESETVAIAFTPACWLEAQITGRLISVGTIGPANIPGIGKFSELRRTIFEAYPVFDARPTPTLEFDLTPEPQYLEP